MATRQALTAGKKDDDMQTFLPLADFKSTMTVLDYKRLGKQRVEALQLLRALRGETRGWTNHPAARMWRGYEKALALYMNFAIDEWVRRGYRNTMKLEPVNPRQVVKLPPWFGDERLHASHRSNLLRKDSVWYGQWGWAESDDLPYVWPGRDE